MAILPQGHQLHQLAHTQHGGSAMLTSFYFSFQSVPFFACGDPLFIASQLSKMRPEEYRSLIKRLETHYQEFLQTSKGSEMFGDDEKKTIQGHFEKAQDHYETLVIQLPAYSEFRQQFCTHFHCQAVSHCCIAPSSSLMSFKTYPGQ